MRDTSVQLDDLRQRLRERDVTIGRLRAEVERLQRELADARLLGEVPGA